MSSFPYVPLQQHPPDNDDDDDDDADNERPDRPLASQRALSDFSRHSVRFMPELATRDGDHIDVEREEARNSEDATSRHSSTWSQISRAFKGKGKARDKKEVEIYESVFKPIPGVTMNGATGDTDQIHGAPLTHEEFNVIVDSVKAAIASGLQPQRISQGSSGSYFCRNNKGKIVGVFKPKNEEPYGQLNPKWTKWIHRNLFPCFFGRSCLIPNLGYISEAAASVLDRRLKLNIVPVTEAVWLSSPAFHYDYLDRRAARSRRNPKPLPEKIGSFQVFLVEYKDADIFLRGHPWPDSHDPNVVNESAELDTDRSRRRRLDVLMCRRDASDDDGDDSIQLSRRFAWTRELQQQFREEFEKLVILDYLMRNTDRGLDNWMIKYCEKDESISIAVAPPKAMSMTLPEKMRNSIDSLNATGSGHTGNSPSVPQASSSKNGTDPNPTSSSTADSPTSAGAPLYPNIRVAAIDNGLAFPFKHPDQWRSYPFGWLSLPRALLDRPFTANTRNRFLGMLTSPQWWKETIADLRELFMTDADFDEGMFAKQMAVLKGQGWNIVETLMQSDQSPLDLCTRQNVIVVDQEVMIGLTDEAATADAGPADDGSRFYENEGSSGASVGGIPIPRRSVSEDGRRSSPLSTSAPSPATYSAGWARKQNWSAKLKSTFDSVTRGRSRNVPNEKRSKRVIIERLEMVEDANPFFKWC